MTIGLNMWPEPSLAGARSGGPRSIEHLERLLGELFQPACPVVVSSGRVGIVLTLLAMKLSRVDLVRMFPYASHCVIDAIGRVATPTQAMDVPGIQASLVYHQWGFIQPTASGGSLIEDAVDSFCCPGAALFRAGGEFEIWSLSKIFGSLGGGVVWCRSDESARVIRALRDARRGGTVLRWMVHLLGIFWPNILPYWLGTEASGGPAPAWGLRGVAVTGADWQRVAVLRHERIGLIKSFAPDWLPAWSDRLPCVIPVEVADEAAVQLSALGFVHGYRHFESARVDGDRVLRKVFPLPVHQQVPIRALERATHILRS